MAYLDATRKVAVHRIALDQGVVVGVVHEALNNSTHTRKYMSGRVVMNKRERACGVWRVAYDRLPALRVHAERGRRLFVLAERIERDRAFNTLRLGGVDRSRRGGALEVGEVFLELGNMRRDSGGRRAADGHGFLRSDKPCVLVAYCLGRLADVQVFTKRYRSYGQYRRTT